MVLTNLGPDLNYVFMYQYNGLYLLQRLLSSEA